MPNPARTEPEIRDEEEETQIRTGIEADMEEVQQPIPFQMGLTPQPDEVPGDELTDWYEENPTSEARGSTDIGPMPEAKATIRRRKRSPQNLRNRQVARSILNQNRELIGIFELNRKSLRKRCVLNR